VTNAKVHLLELKDVPETDDREGGRPSGRETETDVPERDGRCVFIKTVEGLSGYYCLISFNGLYGSTVCVSLIDDSGGVCGCGCVVG